MALNAEQQPRKRRKADGSGRPDGFSLSLFLFFLPRRDEQAMDRMRRLRSLFKISGVKEGA